MPNPQRQKGDRFEREIVKAFTDAGVAAERVPLSGAAGGSFNGDVVVEVCGASEKHELKIRKRAWLDLYGWLTRDIYALIIRRNATPGEPQPEALVVMRLTDYIRHCKGIF